MLYAYSVDGETLELKLDYVSPQLVDMLGVPPSLWREDPDDVVRDVHPDDRDDAYRRSVHTWRTGEFWNNEYRIIGSDGSIKWWADRGTCVERDADGPAVAVRRGDRRHHRAPGGDRGDRAASSIRSVR